MCWAAERRVWATRLAGGVTIGIMWISSLAVSDGSYFRYGGCEGFESGWRQNTAGVYQGVSGAGNGAPALVGQRCPFGNREVKAYAGALDCNRSAVLLWTAVFRYGG